jgi:rubredoxin
MKRYVCTVCGYIYEEAKGIPEAGIAPGTAWEKLPESWVCPLCGASRAEFKEVGGSTPVSKPASQFHLPVEERELSALELSAVCSNLARGCEKQYMGKESEAFAKLADYFKAVSTPAAQADMGRLLTLVEEDLTRHFPVANAVSAEAKDRGALRALVWSEKVSRILKSLLTRYEKEGDAMLANTGVYVCTICGFLYVGDNLPEICPVCKVPNWKFEKIEGRATA